MSRPFKTSCLNIESNVSHTLLCLNWRKGGGGRFPLANLGMQFCVFFYFFCSVLPLSFCHKPATKVFWIRCQPASQQWDTIIISTSIIINVHVCKSCLIVCHYNSLIVSHGILWLFRLLVWNYVSSPCIFLLLLLRLLNKWLTNSLASHFTRERKRNEPSSPSRWSILSSFSCIIREERTDWQRTA